MPPCRAIWIAISDSVTVSIGELTNGTCSSMLRESLVLVTTSSTPKSMCPGSRMMSPYVSAGRAAPVLSNSWAPVSPSFSCVSSCGNRPLTAFAELSVSGSISCGVWGLTCLRARPSVLVARRHRQQTPHRQPAAGNGDRRSRRWRAAREERVVWGVRAVRTAWRSSCRATWARWSPSWRLAEALLRTEASLGYRLGARQSN